jgi:hypothetical protein
MNKEHIYCALNRIYKKKEKQNKTKRKYLSLIAVKRFLKTVKTG